MINICPRCGGFDFIFEAKKENVEIGTGREGLPITEFEFYKENLICKDCGYILYDEYLDSENMKRKFEVYCVLNDMLLPSQIINIARGLSLSKEEFASQTGIDLEEINSIYQGWLPTKQVSDKIKEFAKKVYLANS